ncbi:endonuclease [Flavobacterium branchiophilum]|uniref:Endonuclease/exonuclease/phosphatase family metal-dependent hydrolase n=1 Tax=Flavobacterium branchiophilum TaxID=55197 RepID=A0A543G674_9FLAO|nr:endonuclease/exonuclease/phosphatase family protein [Flavobacterium branchiophilum]OXA80226.1 endonuclease [Flavobacterium branchiophilum] [Flavobacterium branchiophilum NBRC 15030 = ATCC 35035]TQM41590.1 endonuclease/exonuclease/phosphatase family metal-dependent hydrolase [Flavobacterium branchiophilum]GEM55651.1 endonuclease [Flavobacterium branchiophilum NBRC 15030 = ATCC 35035]
MKNLSWFNKIMFFLNIVLTILTFLAYVLPFLAPKLFPLLSVLTLILPFFLIINAIYFIYWFIQFKNQMILSGLVLLLGITFINKFYKISGLDLPKSDNDFKVMSYNVRLFNLFKWKNDDNIPQNIRNFINDQNADIVCIQEYSAASKVNLRVYKYNYILMLGKNIKTAQAIFSKYPIVESGNIEFPNSDNNAVFADIKKGKDTIRVYNIHLESIKITPDVNELNEGKHQISEKKSLQIFNRISNAFKEQQRQAELIMNHKKNCPYPILICGDMNNSPYSYVYRGIRGDMNDAFEEAGTHFGETYHFKYYPVRIDYIFVDKRIKIKNFNHFSDFKNSDHYPIMARLEMK